MAIARSLIVDIAMNTAKITKDISKIRGDFDNLGAAAKNLGKILATSISTGIFVNFIESQIDAADAMQDLSKRIGVSVTDLAGLKLVAHQSGTDLESMATAIKKLEVSMVGAATNQELAQTLKLLGVNAKDPAQALYQLSDAFKNLGDSPERTAVAIKLMGKAGDSAIPALAGGGEALRQMMARGKELSGVTEESARRADEFNDKLAEMQTAAGNVGLAIGMEMIPSFLRLTKEMDAAVKASGGFGAAFQNAAILNFNPQLIGITNNLGALQEKLEKGILTSAAREAVRAQIQFLKEQQREAALALNIGGDQGREGLNRTAISLPTKDIDKNALALAGQYKELEDKVNAIHKAGLDEREKLDLKYIEDSKILTDANKANVESVNSDKKLGIARLALQEEYFQKRAEIEDKWSGGSKLANSIAAEQEAQKQALASRVVSIQDSLKSEDKLLTASYDKKMLDLYTANQTMVQIDEEGHLQRLLGDEEFLEAKKKLELDYHAKSGDVWARAEERAAAFDEMSAEQKVNTFADGLANMTAASAQYDKKAFEANKVARLIQAVMAMRESAATSFAWGSRHGGPWVGAAMAAAAVALQMPNINAIKNATFGGAANTSSGGGGGGGAISVGGASEQPNLRTESQLPSQNITINIQNGVGDATYWQNLIDEVIVPGINDASERNVNLNIRTV